MTAELVGVRTSPERAKVGVLEIAALTETDLIDHVGHAWTRGDGGWIVTANVDIARAAARRPELAALIGQADLVIADGMPLVWAARIAGDHLPERVTGSSLVFSLSAAAAAAGRSVYLLGGEPGVPDAAADALTARYPALKVAGAHSPSFGFERDPGELAEVIEAVRGANPDLVLVGLGFPKQEHLIRRLREVHPDAWYVGCGAGIPMAAGEFSRAPERLQRLGGEWLHRLALEPKRLARRYFVDDAPFALRLLAGAALRRVRG
ncbi:WecB/TagA/CpsF family glycosyltransferase [Amycolatopsis albispora]|uniref:Glycosyltransferase n=1 Tax=Amycolatopsis albispora TaxID=1804986 RepID=A0A344LF89_9PSEU|nr:WecB/TagA/CpsF family glycosyltransferase [Amycolatopsis albispora]AXB46713.1 glycosyltransferase [Amycolatopsis albispora]